MGVPYSCSVFQEEYGADDDDKILRNAGHYWSGFVILFLLQNDGSASRRGVRRARAFTASQANGINELPLRCGGYLQALCRVAKIAGRVQGRCNARREVDANA